MCVLMTLLSSLLYHLCLVYPCFSYVLMTFSRSSWTLHIFGWPVYKDCVHCSKFWIFCHKDFCLLACFLRLGKENPECDSSAFWSFYSLLRVVHGGDVKPRSWLTEVIKTSQDTYPKEKGSPPVSWLILPNQAPSGPLIIPLYNCLIH